MAMTDYFDLPLRDTADGSGGRSRKRQTTAHRIFRSAIELMREDGFHGVAVEQICQHADVARATFFQHFPSKAALMSVFSEIVRHRIEDELANQALAPNAQLRLIVDHLQRLTNELGPIVPDMLSAFTTEPGSGFRIEDPETGLTQLIVEIVRTGQSDGSFARQWPAKDVAIGLISAWISVAQRYQGSETVTDEGPLHGVLKLVLNGLETR